MTDSRRQGAGSRGRTRRNAVLAAVGGLGWAASPALDGVVDGPLALDVAHLLAGTLGVVAALPLEHDLARPYNRGVGLAALAVSGVAVAPALVGTPVVADLVFVDAFAYLPLGLLGTGVGLGAGPDGTPARA
jgi:hypothetical protein